MDDSTAHTQGVSPALRAHEERPLFVFPVPLRDFIAKLQLPQGITHEEANKIARVVLSLADPEAVTPSKPPRSE